MEEDKLVVETVGQQEGDVAIAKKIYSKVRAIGNAHVPYSVLCDKDVSIADIERVVGLGLLDRQLTADPEQRTIVLTFYDYAIRLREKIVRENSIILEDEIKEQGMEEDIARVAAQQLMNDYHRCMTEDKRTRIFTDKYFPMENTGDIISLIKSKPHIPWNYKDILLRAQNIPVSQARIMSDIHKAPELVVFKPPGPYEERIFYDELTKSLRSAPRMDSAEWKSISKEMPPVPLTEDSLKKINGSEDPSANPVIKWWLFRKRARSAERGKIDMYNSSM